MVDEDIKYPALDHGYVKLIEVYGQDSSIIEAARMSTNKGFQGWGLPCPRCEGIGELETSGGSHHSWVRCDDCKGQGKSSGDEKLLKYLYDHKHATPFEFAGMIIEVQAPIFVFREWHRHRTQSYNEMSARYTPLPDVNYVPSVDRILGRLDPASTNKQAGTIADVDMIDEGSAEGWRHLLKLQYADSEKLYQQALKAGVLKELARIILPVGRYSRMRASANLRNWLAFLTLRMDPNAQWEIRQYANQVGALIEEHFPRTWELFAASRDQ